MAFAPVWITDAGSLGVVPEGKFYRLILDAEDPDFPGDPTRVTYSVIAGSLPDGVQINSSGVVEGIPASVGSVKGVPSAVSENTTSKFAVRIVDGEGRVADRTFTLTVSGQDKPKWVTPSGSIGEHFASTGISFQFEVSDLDPGDEYEVLFASGEIPKGLTLSTDGLLSGYVEPLYDLGSGEIEGFDATGFSGFPLDFVPGSIDHNYQFTLKVTDGKDVSLRTFDIFIKSVDIAAPYITNNVAYLGLFRHDNYFAHKFNGKDAVGDQIQYEVAFGALPPGLVLDAYTGWLSGYLPDLALTEATYNFGIKVFKTNYPTNKSELYLTSMDVIGNIDTEVIWVTDTDLGTIDNGGISEFTIEATHADTELFYRFKEGTKFYYSVTVDDIVYTADESNTIPADTTQLVAAHIPGPEFKLPQGLTLLPSGNIVGQVSFKTFSLDAGTTTFGEDYATRLNVDPTTFDLSYTFTVEAHSADDLVRVTKVFTILINREYNSPYNVLYCKAMPPREDRVLLDTLLTNNTVIPPETIYRADDANFGLSNRVVYEHAFGLTPATIDDYFASLALNHYNKNLVLGEVKTARALDADDNVVYEVVYSQIVDKLVNADSDSVNPMLPINYPAIDDNVSVSTVYPNSLENMQLEVVDTIGQESKVLPTWMLSKQENGEVLGFTPAWVIAYAKPDESKLIQYKINEFFGTQLNTIDFEIDRYALDANLSKHWDLTNQEWNASGTSTFDRTKKYIPYGDEVTVDESEITVGDTRYNIDAFIERLNAPLPYGYIPRDPGLYGSPYETLFDGGTCRFASPIDIYDPTDGNDKYIKFPKVMIINNEQ